MTSERWVAAVTAALALMLGGAACAQVGPAKRTLVSGDQVREYYVHLPKNYDPSTPMPLVLALHGGGGTAAGMDRSTGGQLAGEADLRGWIVAFPQGLSKSWNDGRGVPRQGQDAAPDDVAFLSALIDRLATDHAVDRTRVYATGISNGGFMSFRLAVELSDKIAAVAPVTATLPKALAVKTPARPVGVMIVNGTRDPLVPYGGGHVSAFGRKRGGPILSTAASVRWFVEHNGCQKTPRTVQLPDKAQTDGCLVDVHRYETGREGAEVVLYEVKGGGHTWPGGKQYFPRRLIGVVCRDFRAGQHIFDFFARHRRAPRSGTGGAR